MENFTLRVVTTRSTGAPLEVGTGFSLSRDRAQKTIVGASVPEAGAPVLTPGSGCSACCNPDCGPQSSCAVNARVWQKYTLSAHLALERHRNFSVTGFAFTASRTCGLMGQSPGCSLIAGNTTRKCYISKMSHLVIFGCSGMGPPPKAVAPPPLSFSTSLKRGSRRGCLC